MTARHALVDVLVALALFLLVGLLLAVWSSTLPAVWRFPVTIVSQGVLLLAAVALILGWRRQPWSCIWLLAPKAQDLGRGALAFGACLGLNVVLVHVLHDTVPAVVESHTEQLGAIARRLSEGLSLGPLIVMLCFVGIYEELFARGLLLSRCQALLGGFWAPVIVSSVLFGLGHLYQGWIGVGQTTLVGLVLAVATLRWGSIWPAIIAHALLDISSVLLMSGFD